MPSRREWLPKDSDDIIVIYVESDDGPVHQFEPTMYAHYTRAYCRVCGQKFRHENHLASDGRYEYFNGHESRSYK